MAEGERAREHVRVQRIELIASNPFIIGMNAFVLWGGTHANHDREDHS
jgi:hypothetical protein